MQPLNDENQYSAKLYNALKKQTFTDFFRSLNRLVDKKSLRFHVEN